MVGFCEPSSGDDKICQLVGWDTCEPDFWKAASPNTVPAAFDLNSDAIYVIPQLSAENFSYMRVPHVSHGVFAAGPITGTYALPRARLVALCRYKSWGKFLICVQSPS